MGISSLFLLSLLSQALSSHASPPLFREYIGAMFNGVKLSDVPVHPDIDFHFILAFAIDYTTTATPNHTDGHFNVFWDTGNISSSSIAAFKQAHPNVKFALSLGGDTVGDSQACFNPLSVDSWVSKAVSSLTSIIQEYHLDGIDIDYEHFNTTPRIFAECIGRVLEELKERRVVSFASIAPFDNPQVQKHYIALWSRSGHLIDYVNFQFYAYDNSTTELQFLKYVEAQRLNYNGGKVLVGFSTEQGGGGLSLKDGFFSACRHLKLRGELDGIFVWSADTSLSNGGFKHENLSQALLLSDH